MDPERDIKAGSILKLLRDEKGLTQDDLADLLKVKRQTYSAWERNISNPDISTINFLADYYKVSVDYLLGRTDKRNYDDIETIAAHHDGDEWTDEELEDIEKFKEYVRMRREQKNKK